VFESGLLSSARSVAQQVNGVGFDELTGANARSVAPIRTEEVRAVTTPFKDAGWLLLPIIAVYLRGQLRE
jgi:hypothetical protein